MGMVRKALLVFSLVAASGIACWGQDTSPTTGGVDVESRIAGTWRGNSVCMVKNSPCHDEVNVYHFSKLAGRPSSFLATASKVVDGKEIVMGSGAWTYDAAKQVMECKAPAIRLVVEGSKMEGSLTLSDGTVYRRISLKKAD
jgi:hypothetical protein